MEEKKWVVHIVVRIPQRDRESSISDVTMWMNSEVKEWDKEPRVQKKKSQKSQSPSVIDGRTV